MRKTPKKPAASTSGRDTSRVTGRMVEQTTTRFFVRSGSHASQEIRFGGVLVEAATPSEAIEKRNIAEGRSALSRAKSALMRPGVQVRVAAGVPLYHADPSSSGLIVRTVNGRTTKGRFVGGKFKPA